MLNTPDLTLYLGGTRSGKSTRAEARALQSEGPVLYVATAEARPDDPSMLQRIRQHRARRPGHWHTLECPLRMADAIAAALRKPPFSPEGLRPSDVSPTRAKRARPGTPKTACARPTILVDCVTLWVSNILFSLPDPEDPAAFEAAVRAETDALLGLIEGSAYRWIVVSGETGLGGIAPTRLVRNHCDGLGLANQMLAARAREVFLVVAGRLLALAE